MKRILLTTLSILTFFSVLSQDKNDFNAFDRARRCGTIECFKQYLNEYPDGQYAEDIKKFLPELNDRNSNQKEVAKKIRRNAQIKDFLLGSRDGFNASVYLERQDQSETYQLSLMYHLGYSPLAFSYGAFVVLPEDEYISAGWSAFDFSLYLSPRSGKGPFATVGYRPNVFTDQNFNDDFFFRNTSEPGPEYVFQDRDPEDIDVGMSRLHYGVGYQNTYGKLFIGVSYEWYQKRYTADSDERLSFEGLDETVEGEGWNFRIGFNF